MVANAESERYQRYLCSREWSEKKEAVRLRSKGICERCNWREMAAVHHLTYIRKYHEELADLQAICEECHQFVHGKAAYDPATDRPLSLHGRYVDRVYLAGKISRNDWRHSIVKGSLADKDPGPASDPYDYWQPGRGVIPVPGYRSLVYSGPFFTELGNGKSHLIYRHASDAEGVVSLLCQESIDHCDLVFAWIDREDCYGTLVELGYASAKGKLIYVAGPVFFPELWLACSLANKVEFRRLDAAIAFTEMVTKKAGESFGDFRQGEIDGHFGDPVALRLNAIPADFVAANEPLDPATF